VNVPAEDSAEFQAFRRRCRYDILIQRRLQSVQDEAVVRLANDYGFDITVADLRRQRRRFRRDRHQKPVGFDRISILLSALIRPFRWLFSFRQSRPK